MKSREFIFCIFLFENPCKITADYSPEIFAEKINQSGSDNAFYSKKDDAANPEFFQHFFPSRFLLFFWLGNRLIRFHLFSNVYHDKDKDVYNHSK